MRIVLAIVNLVRILNQAVMTHRNLFLFAFVFAALLLLLGIFTEVPTPDELIPILETYFQQWGYLVIFIAAVAEGMLLLGWYFPGSAAVIIGAIFSRTGALSIVMVIFLAISGLSVAYMVDYVLGRYGWYKLLLRLGLREPLERATHQVNKFGVRTIIVAYAHPHIGALVATAAGILHMKWLDFSVSSAISVTLWMTIWGLAGYTLGSLFLSIANNWFILLAILGILVIWSLTASIIDRRKHSKSESGTF